MTAIPDWLRSESFWTEQVRGIKENKTDGSVVLATVALKALEELIIILEKKGNQSQTEKLAIIKTACQELVDLRPNMLVLANTAALFYQLMFEAITQNQAIADVIKLAEDRISLPSRQAGAHLAAFLKQTSPQNVITLTNSSTILYGLKTLAETSDKSSLPRFIVLESRPQCEGVKFGEGAAQYGYNVDLITDSQVGLFTRRADCALAGIDTLYLNGDFINRTGTLALALACQYYKRPFYVVGDTLKLSANPTEMALLEENNPAELADAWHMPYSELPSPIKVHNYYFEPVSTELVTGYILENGFVKPESLKDLVSDVSQRLQNLIG
jgi:translation initiation factor 2B subunit (eIF-2B alpha/beta/delta family)